MGLSGCCGPRQLSWTKTSPTVSRRALRPPVSRRRSTAGATPSEGPTPCTRYNDEFGLVLIQALTDAGLRVPEDSAVIGTDNHPLGAALRPALTTTCLDPAEGVAAVASSVERLLGGERLDPGLAEIARPRLVTRSSA
ncbi:substrate-binding domain-containing protein [Streptomyces sp. NPDC014646]|uniref:substrate-binding domain-containing protein n=1 Tax=Streptomyces sp. NPDC014646 TaxID=3364877 RepID=UPI0036FC1B1E